MSPASLRAKLKPLQHVALWRSAYVSGGENDFHSGFVRMGGNVGRDACD